MQFGGYQNLQPVAVAICSRIAANFFTLKQGEIDG